ncbi:MAG: bifunctional ADP-dependent NAD(P)H-hydrate dehydratase/NAD(P)H-hydrate epimerase, partial [Oscillospiraceae bacterium]|nr:bifunctional ADP-dependent NAD(P)H-hydrate dehydratase/NAD(P)H-hydrate epimerase [Oscillospiraceae bacterium]
MLPLTTAAAMREADRRAIEDRGIPSITLMERASRAVAAAAEPYLAQGGAALVLCGSGNNGGDGV